MKLPNLSGCRRYKGHVVAVLALFTICIGQRCFVEVALPTSDMVVAVMVLSGLYSGKCYVLVVLGTTSTLIRLLFVCCLLYTSDAADE